MTPSVGPGAELNELATEYEFFEELGRGGSAIVYRARDRALGRDVAIKVVHARPTSRDDDPVARLAREARTVAQLHHPGIVSVYAVRRLQAGGLTLVMQFVPGATLKQVIQRGGPFEAGRAEEILRDVAQALAYAHSRHVVHRDVKPENIFLDAESGRALLADFGIARSGEADSLTMTGTAIGTPFYMSPEQVDGLPVDGRSDVYSLGLVAWEMLTGLRPWDGESLYHVIYKQKHDELPPIEALRRDVPRRLQYIVERMLQKQPAARWAGADGLLAQLDRTILPGDYAQWQAALPGRVARHHTVVGLQRPGDIKGASAASAGAATVQFTPTVNTRTQSTATTSDRSPVGAAVPAVVPITILVTGLEDAPAALAVDADSESTPAGARAAPTSSDTGALAYDTIAPTWAYADPGARPEISQRWAPRALRNLAIGTAAVALGAAALGARDVATRVALPTAFGQLGLPTPPSRVHALRAPIAVSRWIARGFRPDSQAFSAGDAGELTSGDLVTLGAHHACSITLAGGAQCWGRNDGAQLGDGSSAARRARAQPVAGVMTYSGVAAGAAHTCGVTGPGDIYCWGTNDHGQLGDGTTSDRSAPVRVAGAGTYRLVRGGESHTCALDVEGPVRCWGDNTSGQLGDGTHSSQSLPAVVRLPNGASAIGLATGAEHSCALLSDERVFCWGSNRDGQLGIMGVATSTNAREVPGVRATAIGAGDAHTCAVLESSAVLCWGRDTNGQLGTGGNQRGAPGRLTIIPGREDVRAVVAGAAHSCALTRGGWIWCWGHTPPHARQLVYQLGRGPYIALAAAAAGTCAVPAGRVAECWTGVGVEPSRVARPTRRRRAMAWRARVATPAPSASVSAHSGAF